MTVPQEPPEAGAPLSRLHERQFYDHSRPSRLTIAAGVPQ